MEDLEFQALRKRAEYNAAKYLSKVNPKRYYWDEDILGYRLCDREDPYGFRHHERRGINTSLTGYFGAVPLYSIMKQVF